nr:hypothetical protein [Nostoc sp. ChiSLP03a]
MRSQIFSGKRWCYRFHVVGSAIVAICLQNLVASQIDSFDISYTNFL